MCNYINYTIHVILSLVVLAFATIKQIILSKNVTNKRSWVFNRCDFVYFFNVYMELKCLWNQGRGKLLFNDNINFSYFKYLLWHDIMLYESFLITLFHLTIQYGVRRAKRSTAEAPQAGKDEVISGCYNRNKWNP